MADIIQKSGYEVVVEGTTYSMVAIPEASSALVTKQKDRVLRNLKLEKLITNLMRAGELLFLAYNGVAGHKELRESVTLISDDLARLAGDCEATMFEFERSAKNILDNLRDCFKYLLQGKEQWAITWLGKAGAQATEMATKADGLAVRFDALGNTAVATLGKTMIAQGQAEETREQLNKDMANLEAETAGAKRLAEELLGSKATLQRLYEEYKTKAETAENRGFALSIVNAVMKPIGEGLGAFAGAMTRTQSPMGVMSMMPPTVSASPPGSSYAPPPMQPPGGAPPPVSRRSDAGAGPPLPLHPPLTRLSGVEPPPGLGAPPPMQAPGDTPPPATPWDEADEGPPPPGVDPAAVAGAAAAGATLSSAGASAGQMGGDLFSLAESYNREKGKYLDKLLELQKEERDTAKKIAEYAVRLKNAGESKQITEATITSLFQAIGALKQISVVLRVGAMFWRQMGAHCKELANSDLKEKVTMFMTAPPDQRLVFFLDEDFKVQVVTYLGGWKAVEVIAIDYGVTCGKVRAQIQEDFVKNPNTEQSRRLAPILGAKLLDQANADLGENATQTRAIEAELASMRPAA
jgi:hypothetical protein